MRALFWYAGPVALAAPPPTVTAPPSPRLPPEALWLALARRAVAEGRDEEALRCFDSALAYAPRLALAHFGRVGLLWELGRDAEALAATRAMMEAAEDDPSLLYDLARLIARGGHVTVAAPLLARLAREAPDVVERAASDPVFADHPAYLQAIGRL